MIRHKENIQYKVIKENELPAHRHQHILKDEIIELKNTVTTQQVVFNSASVEKK